MVCLSAGKQRNGLELFAGGPGNDLDTAFEQVVFRPQNEIGFGPAEYFGEHARKLFANLLEGLRNISRVWE